MVAATLLDLLATRTAPLPPVAHELPAVRLAVPLRRFREGLIDTATLYNELAALRCPQELLNLYVYSAQLEAELDEFTDYLAALKTAVAKGAIDPPDMTKLLIQRGLSEERAELLARHEALRLLPTPRRT